jgi:hypothetical protein
VLGIKKIIIDMEKFVCYNNKNIKENYMKEETQKTLYQLCLTDEHIATKKRLYAYLNESRKNTGLRQSYAFWNWVKDNLDREEAMSGKSL